MKKYDPDRPVDPKQWLALDDGERLHMILKYHRRAGDPLPNPQIHAHFHAIVETQIALGDELPVRATLERLMAEGLDRHDAVHAIGSVLATHIYDILQGEAADKDPNPAYFAALEQLTAESWLSQAEEDDDEEDDFDEVEEDDDFVEAGDAEEDDFEDDEDDEDVL
jgi:hypothetical protein